MASTSIKSLKLKEFVIRSAVVYEPENSPQIGGALNASEVVDSAAETAEEFRTTRCVIITKNR